jgi:pimeloyl-ACP methyl ester carboxylesterase
MIERHTPDGKTAYFEAGERRPLVLLHGFPLSKAMWQPQLDGLADVARVLAPDLPGFGGSRTFDGQPTVDAMADRVAEFLDGLQIREPAVIGGLSMGGYVTLAFARRHAGRLRGLVLADTRAEPDDEAGRGGREKTIALARQSGPGAVIDQMVPNLFAAASVTRRPALADAIRELGAAQSTEGVVAALQAMRDRPDARPHLGSIAVPTLILVGAEDALTPPARSELMHGAIQGSRLVVLPGAGHVANLEQSEAFNAAVRDFLAATGL